MKAVWLRYEMNPCTGLPELRAPEGKLDTSERRALEAELAHRYAELVDRAGGPCVLRTRTRLAPNGRFLVRVRPGHPRLPTLLLTPYPTAGTVPPREAPADWRERLVDELKGETAADCYLDRRDAASRAFEQAVSGLADFALRRPDRLPLVLPAGYLALSGDSTASGPERQHLCRLALGRVRQLLRRRRRKGSA